MTIAWPAATIVAADPNIVFCDLDKERVLLDLTSSRYFALNRVGVHVWETIATPTSVGALQDNIEQRFDVRPEQCRKDLESLLSNLSQFTLISVQHAPAS